jgi:hypothetical protein
LLLEDVRTIIIEACGGAWLQGNASNNNTTTTTQQHNTTTQQQEYERVLLEKKTSKAIQA